MANELKNNEYDTLFIGYPTCDLKRYIDRVMGVLYGVERDESLCPAPGSHSLCVPRPYVCNILPALKHLEDDPQMLKNDLEKLYGWGYQDGSLVDKWRKEIPELARDHPPEKDHIPPRGPKVYFRYTATEINPESDFSILEKLLSGNGLKLYKRIK